MAALDSVKPPQSGTVSPSAPRSVSAQRSSLQQLSEPTPDQPGSRSAAANPGPAALPILETLRGLGLPLEKKAGFRRCLAPMGGFHPPRNVPWWVNAPNRLERNNSRAAAQKTVGWAWKTGCAGSRSWRVNALNVRPRRGMLRLGHRHPLIRPRSRNPVDNLFRPWLSVAEGPRWRRTTTTSPPLNIPPDHPARDMQTSFYLF